MSSILMKMDFFCLNCQLLKKWYFRELMFNCKILKQLSLVSRCLSQKGNVIWAKTGFPLPTLHLCKNSLTFLNARSINSSPLIGMNIFFEIFQTLFSNLVEPFWLKLMVCTEHEFWFSAWSEGSQGGSFASLVVPCGAIWQALRNLCIASLLLQQVYHHSKKIQNHMQEQKCEKAWKEKP